MSQQDNDIMRRFETEKHFATGGTPEELGDDISDLVTQLQQTEEFRKIKQQVEEYRKFVQGQWEGNLPQTTSIIRGLTGFDLNKAITVKLTHPDLANGLYVDNNTITWGNHEDWDNLSTVYLWHETLHSYLGYTPVEHAVIQ